MDLTFFFLDEKEPKNQDRPDPSGRFVRPLRTWAAIFLTALPVQKLVSKRSILKELINRKKGDTCKIAIQAREIEWRPEVIRHS